VETGLAGRSALVSGGSKGIGKGIARALAREGVSVALLARTEHEVLAAAQEIAGETGVTVVGVQADVTDTNSLKAAVAHLSDLASFNALNIVVKPHLQSLARIARSNGRIKSGSLRSTSKPSERYALSARQFT
jgi:NAD(P)-dependent dehydrogenase (short-subunit alcohol dehydrogenase family)